MEASIPPTKPDELPNLFDGIVRATLERLAMRHDENDTFEAFAVDLSESQVALAGYHQRRLGLPVARKIAMSISRIATGEELLLVRSEFDGDFASVLEGIAFPGMPEPYYQKKIETSSGTTPDQPVTPIELKFIKSLAFRLTEYIDE